MTQYKFTAEHYDGSKVTYECNVDTISDVLQGFEYFLRGVGFYPEGTLDFVSDDYTQTEAEDITHDDSYYEFDRNKPIGSYNE